MEKNYQSKLTLEQQKYIKEMLFEKYGENFQKYGMSVSSDLEICNLAEFFITEHPEKYAKSIEIENNYRNDENLRKIYAVVSKEKNVAVMINTSNEGKAPEGEFGVYNLENNTFKLTNEIMREEIRKRIKKYTKDTLGPENEEEMIDELTNQLSDMDKLATRDLNKERFSKEIDAKINNLVDEKIDEINSENGISPIARKKLEEREDDKEQVKTEEQSEEKNQISEDVVKAAKKLGVTSIKGYAYYSPQVLNETIEGVSANENSGNVLVIRVQSSAEIGAPDQYYGFQNDKLVLYGQDKSRDMEKMEGRPCPADGKVIKDLTQNKNVTYVELPEMNVKEKLESNFNNEGITIQKLELYQRDVQKLLEEYSNKVNAIIENDNLSPEEKEKELIENNNYYDTENVELAQKYGINIQDVEAINLQTTEYSEDKEQEQEEIQKEDDGYDDRGRPTH